MHRWKLSALAAAAFVSAALTTTDAAALALGPLNVQSAQGENLRAEIAISEATAEELDSLMAQVASPDVFRAHGMDYSSAVDAIAVQLVRKPDGTTSLQLSSDAPLQEALLNLVLQTQWSTGQLVRSYTLLLQPAAKPEPATAPISNPQVTSPAPASVTGKTYSSNNAPSPSPRAITPAPKASSAAAPTRKPAAAGTLRVRTGDTAGRIANAQRPRGVSLDQMLVAMLRSNPKAFINGNVNRIRAGAVVQMPSRDQALAISASEARQIVAAQSRDFNAYRRSLASKAPKATVQTAARTSSGQVQAQVADARPTADTPDKLTLSKGAIQNAAALEEAKLAAQKQAADQDNRLSELQRNLAELNELAGSTTATAQVAPTVDAQAAAPAPASTTETATPAAPESAALEITNATAAAVEASTSAAAASDAPVEPAADASETPPAAPAEPAAPATSEAEPAATPSPAATPAPAAAPSETSQGLGSPWVPAGAGLLALILGALGYTAWKRRRPAPAGQNANTAATQPSNAFFGSSDEQPVDTPSADNSTFAMANASSQLNRAGDVDPVEEADMHLAYGRDVQAEEILKEALRRQPAHLPVHAKLAEIYVKRHDIKSLEGVARSLHEASHGQGPEWQRVLEMGRRLDPSHPFFAGAATPAATAASNQPTSAFAAALNSLQPSTQATASGSAATAAAATAAMQSMPDIDLNLDFPDSGFGNASTNTQPLPARAQEPAANDFGITPAPSPRDGQFSSATTPQGPNTFLPEDSKLQDASSLDLDLSAFDVTPKAKPPVAPPAPTEMSMDLGVNLNFDVDTPAAPPAVEPPPAQSTPEVPAGLNFDVGSLDLDVAPAPEPAAQPEPVHNLADDPLSTKLDLAQEFNAIGDSEGARALIEEVLAEASGPLKERAQKLLSQLD